MVVDLAKHLVNKHMNQELFSLPAMEIKKTIKSPLTTEFIFEHLENGLATT